MNQIPKHPLVFYADDDRWCSSCDGKGFIREYRTDGTWINETCFTCKGTKLHGVCLTPEEQT